MCTRPFSAGRFSSAGIALVEVLVATGLFVTVAASIPYLFLSATRTNSDAGAITLATTLAAQRLEELRSQSPPGSASAELIELVDQWGRPLADPDSTTPAYTRRSFVTALSSASPGTLALSVAVSRYRVGDELLASDIVTTQEVVRLVTVWTGVAP